MSVYRFFDRLMLRAPAYSFSKYAPERVAEVLGTEQFRSAVLLASRDFYGVLKAADFEWEKLTAKAQFTLVKYYNRMCFRPTPFGAFASFSVLEWGEGMVRFTGNPKLHAVRDRAEVLSEAGQLMADGASLLGLSPLVYRLGQEFRFYRKESADPDKRFAYRIDALAAEPLTALLFDELRKGPVSGTALRSLISRETGSSEAEAAGFIDFLLAEGLLTVFGTVAELISDGGVPAADSGAGSDPSPGYYAALEQPVSGGPSFADRAELERVVNALQVLCTPLYTEPEALKQFRQAFRKKFGDRKVPVLLAADPDAGIVYEEGSGGHLPGWGKLHQLFLRRWIQDRDRAFYDHLELTDDDLLDLRTDAGMVKFPPTIPVLFRSAGEELLIEYAGGATASALAGRFSLFSDDVLDLCREIARAEQSANPDVIFADIFAENGPHTDNINQRRRIYDYEISLAGSVDAECMRKLMPDDLYLSIQNDELILESRRLGCRVVPRLSTAFNPRHSGLGIFRLLCAMQYQGQLTALVPDMEALFPGLAFYPRLVYGRTVLSPAKWLIRFAEIPSELSGFRAFRRQYHLPALVTFGQGDRQLVFDLRDGAECSFFVECIRAEKEVRLTEYISSGRMVRNGNGASAGQFLGLLHHTDRVFERLRSPFTLVPESVQRSFPPGSDWLYLKLYCAEYSSSEVLLKVVQPFTEIHSDHIRQWFFVRFRDPEPHIRLRMRVMPGHAGELFAACKDLMAGGPGADLIRSVQLDSYDRELERYTPGLIGEVETVFAEGSTFVMRSLADSNDEMIAALIAVSGMVQAFFPEIERQTELAERSLQGFLLEFAPDRAERIVMDASYRRLRTELQERLAGALAGEQRDALLRAVKKTAALSLDYTHEQRQQLIADLCHMQINRSFGMDQRRQEMVVWNCVCKFLKGERAKILKRRS